MYATGESGTIVYWIAVNVIVVIINTKMLIPKFIFQISYNFIIGFDHIIHIWRLVVSRFADASDGTFLYKKFNLEKTIIKAP